MPDRQQGGWWAWLAGIGRGRAAVILRQGPIPAHVAFIMDGNRRFAASRGSDRAYGHRVGFDRVRSLASNLSRHCPDHCLLSNPDLQLVDALEWCTELGVSHVSAFAFGVENFKRTAEEIDTIMQLAEEKLRGLAQVSHGSCARLHCCYCIGIGTACAQA